MILLAAASGALLAASASADSAAFAVTAFVLTVGVFLKSSTRTRKVASAFYLAAGEALALSGADDKAKHRTVIDKCFAAGSSGIDTGLFRDWWAVPVLHADVLRRLAMIDASKQRPLSPELRERLTWTRDALLLQLDVGA
jgi:hypothetical protein